MKDNIDITIKPTMSCNMKCRHCFNGDEFKDSQILAKERAVSFLRKACCEYENVKVVFHGGEPTLAGIDYYKYFFSKVCEYKKRYNTDIKIEITTNGLLLSDDFIDLLIDNQCAINLSFDGPYNHLLRQQSSKVQEIVFKIRDKGGKLKCFCTISKDSVEHLEEIYYWFRDNGISFKTLPIEKRGYAKIDTSIVMSPEALISQFEKVYRIWLKDKDCKISYSTFEEFSRISNNKIFRRPWFGRKLTLHPDGNIYSYGRPNDAKFSLGNVDTIETLDECFRSKVYEQYVDEIERLCEKKCSNCSSKSSCAGSNIGLAYLYVNDEDLIDYSCNQTNMLVQMIIRVNEQIEEDKKNGRIFEYNSYIQSNI